MPSDVLAPSDLVCCLDIEQVPRRNVGLSDCRFCSIEVGWAGPPFTNISVGHSSTWLRPSNDVWRQNAEVFISEA
jgi:hypothetical protein